MKLAFLRPCALALAGSAMLMSACIEAAAQSVAELEAHPVVAAGCPVGRELARKSIERTAISPALFELTCAADVQPERVFETMDSLVGEYGGKIPWVGPVAIDTAVGARPRPAPELMLPASYAWWPPGFQVELCAFSPSAFPAGARGAGAVYRVTVQKDPFAG